MKKTLFISAFATSALFLHSCNKQDLSRPVSAQQTVRSVNDQNAVARTKPAPGNYKVNLYIDDNDTSTQIFKGYVLLLRIMEL